MLINTNRLELISSTAPMVQHEIDDDDAALSKLLNAAVHAEWPCEHWDRPAMEWTLRSIDSGSAAGGWGMWYFILQPPHIVKRTLIGNGGFKGPPDENGLVEIGYSIVPEHRRRGLATEACRALMEWALQDSRVNAIAAETYPHLVASLGVMRNLGMQILGAGSEPGVVRYGVRRDQIMS